MEERGKGRRKGRRKGGEGREEEGEDEGEVRGREGRGGGGDKGGRKGSEGEGGKGKEGGEGEDGRSVGGVIVTDLHKNPLPRPTRIHTYTHFSHRCLQQLGRNHGYLVSTLVPELLSTHPFFMGKEPDVDDPACIPLHPHCYVPWLWGLEIFGDY